VNVIGYIVTVKRGTSDWMKRQVDYEVKSIHYIACRHVSETWNEIVDEHSRCLYFCNDDE